MQLCEQHPRIPAYIVTDLRESIRALNECNEDVHVGRIRGGPSEAQLRAKSHHFLHEHAWFTYRRSCDDLRANGIDPMPLVLALAEEVAVPLRGCLHSDERRPD